jgi:hypothetical protein
LVAGVAISNSSATDVTFGDVEPKLVLTETRTVVGWLWNKVTCGITKGAGVLI